MYQERNWGGRARLSNRVLMAEVLDLIHMDRCRP
jgi:hypothetical protein